MDFWRFNQPQTVNLQKIEAGIDVRTTIMVRNIPNRVDFEDLKLFLDATSEGHYDFSYVRIDLSNNLDVNFELQPQDLCIYSNFTCVFVSFLSNLQPRSGR
ncbi:unnamed protein product [Aureobasidium uvarum]|uniref:Mei2-like C-terminal RNA recognition motif domain-containing protein n=1 Tax=Aureobasidium uvarum TaxID=2773716 RepID=A0A9N8KIP0_9PEZI|nr:unnamed protein product [Aureobasidium uvarum]